MTVWSTNWNPGVAGRKCINVQPIESPNTDTVNGPVAGLAVASARAGWIPPEATVRRPQPATHPEAGWRRAG